MPSFRSRVFAANFAVAAVACFAWYTPAARAQALPRNAAPPSNTPPEIVSPIWTVRGGPVTPFPPTKHVPFPEIRDFNTVVIRLSRRATMITYSYEVELHADGAVLFSGDGMPFAGKHRCSIPPENVHALVDFMRERDYFSFDDKYSATNVDDGDIHDSSIAFDGQHKSVENYMGQYMGIPRGVIEVENEIDRVAGTMRWLAGNDDTMRCLREENWDFHTYEADAVMARLARMKPRNEALIKQMEDNGAGVLSVSQLRIKFEQLGVGLDDPDARLLKNADPDESPLAIAADIGNPRLMAKVLKSEKDVDKRDWRGLTPLMIAVSRRQNIDLDRGIDRAWTARLLLEAGADPNLADQDGNTALLLNRYDPNVVQYLLEGGAKINAQNGAGETALMRARTPELTNILILNHADPSLRDAAGETALDIAAREHDDAKIAALTGKKLTAHN